ncbi:MAG: ATP-binding protein [Chloroflexota bacterium]
MLVSEVQQLLANGAGQNVVPCAENISARELAVTLIALANADGGTVIVGADGDGQLVGLKSPERAHEVAMRAFVMCNPPLMLPLPEQVVVDEQVLLLLHVPKGMPHVYNLRGKYLIRDEKRNIALGARRLRQLLLERGEVGHESQVVSGATQADLDDRKIRNYLNAVEAFGDVEPADVLAQRGCLRKEGGELRPTVAGMLLFGRMPEAFGHPSCILLAHYTGTQMSDDFAKEEIHDTLPEQIRRAENFIVAHMRKSSRLNRLEREEKLEYPRAAIREVIVNAVAHRDYSIRGDDIRVTMFSDRIEVYSPGRLPGHVTVKNIVDERFSRNDIIVQLLADLGYIERLGYGIDRLLRLMKENGLPRPRFAETANGFKVTLFGPGDAFKVEAVDSARWRRMNLNERQERALRWLQQNQRITNRDYHELYPDVSEETLRRDLVELVDKNILLKIGDKKATYYIFK